MVIILFSHLWFRSLRWLIRCNPWMCSGHLLYVRSMVSQITRGVLLKSCPVERKNIPFQTYYFNIKSSDFFHQFRWGLQQTGWIKLIPKQKNRKRWHKKWDASHNRITRKVLILCFNFLILHTINWVLEIGIEAIKWGINSSHFLNQKTTFI